MLSLDKAEVDNILLQLEEREFIGPRYKFCKQNKGLRLLGKGSFSYVYEVYDTSMKEKHYAAKIIGLGTRPVDENVILETTQIQYNLAEKSDNIMRVITVWTMKIHLDEDGNVIGITDNKQKQYEKVDGTVLQVVLMEKLCSVIKKDKFGNIELLRQDLKTESGVIRFAEDIGRALSHVHNSGFLHRDVKLENVFWDEKLQLYKLGDFGIARYVGDGNAETVAYTDGYGAPEIERHLVDSYNLTADIYSFGITLFLLLNDLKFPASDGYYVNIVQYSKDFIVPAPQKASERVARIIGEMCSYNVEDRYQSIEEVLMDIGRIDGTYTDYGFTEKSDSPTETYREMDPLTETYRDIADEDEDKIKEKIGRRYPIHKAYTELGRKERKERRQIYEAIYTKYSIQRMFISAVLFALLFKALSPDADYLRKWQFWMLPISMFICSILQRVKEFYIEFELITIGLALLSINYLGADVPQVVVILAVLLRAPAITAGCAMGMALWMAQILSGKLLGLDFLSHWDLGWIIIVLIIAMLKPYMRMRDKYSKISQSRYAIWKNTINVIWLVMIIAGFIFFIVDYFDIMIVPDIIKHMHLVRTGIGVWIVMILYYKHYGTWD